MKSTYFPPDSSYRLLIPKDFQADIQTLPSSDDYFIEFEDTAYSITAFMQFGRMSFFESKQP